MKIKNLSTNKKKIWKIIFYISIIFFLFTIFFLFNVFSNLYFKKTTSQSINISEQNLTGTVCNDCSPRNIDGVYVQKEKSNLFPFAVIIDNLPDARPSYGLAQANLVIEAEAEGGITRYFAVFAGEEEIDKIGPVRSARPYFVDWSEGLSALLVHCGGSPEALARIIQEDVYDLNEFYNEKLFWRDNNIRAPHNVFTSTDNLRGYLENKKLIQGKYLSWNFFDTLPDTQNTNPEISVSYYSSSGAENDFNVRWKYDSLNNNYLRYLGEKIHKDGDYHEVRASNVVIQYLDKEIIDDKLRISLQTIGNGKAVVCHLGECQESIWKKEYLSSRTRFYDNNNKEISFVLGTTWIEVVDDNIKVKY